MSMHPGTRVTLTEEGKRVFRRVFEFSGMTFDEVENTIRDRCNGATVRHLIQFGKAAIVFDHNPDTLCIHDLACIQPAK